jgi:hypothetical protein
MAPVAPPRRLYEPSPDCVTGDLTRSTAAAYALDVWWGTAPFAGQPCRVPVSSKRDRSASHQCGRDGAITVGMPSPFRCAKILCGRLELPRRCWLISLAPVCCEKVLLAECRPRRHIEWAREPCSGDWLAACPMETTRTSAWGWLRLALNPVSAEHAFAAGSSRLAAARREYPLRKG